MGEALLSPIFKKKKGRNINNKIIIMDALQMASLEEVLEDNEIKFVKKLNSDKKFITWLLVLSVLFNIFMFWAWSDAVALSVRIIADDIRQMDEQTQLIIK